MLTVTGIVVFWIGMWIAALGAAFTAVRRALARNRLTSKSERGVASPSRGRTGRVASDLAGLDSLLDGPA